MSQERPNALFEELSEKLSNLMRPETSGRDSHSEDPDNPVVVPGEPDEADRVAREVSDNVGTSGEDRELDDDESRSLPLLARLRARGLFEDDWRARPTETHPYPVICVHGTGTTKGDWMELGADLREDGFAVFAPDFGNRATDSIAESADQLGAYIGAVLTVTGADQVILIGHSQGGTLCRYWMRLLDGASKVRHLVCVSVPNHGTTLGGIVSPLVRTAMAENIMSSLVRSWFGDSGFEQVTGHETIESINAGGDLEPGVSYTCIATRGDTVIQPPETCFLYPEEDDPEPERVNNIWLQSIHPRAMLLHNEMPQDERVRGVIREELAQVQ